MKRSLWLALLVSLTFAAPAAAKCDNLDPAVCLQPFPNNYFTKASTKTDTGVKVNFALTSMPRNAASKPIQPGQWNRNDGFSPGSLITTYVPGLDLAKTHGVPINDLARTNDKDAAVVVIDAKTLKRNLIWTEMDSLASSDSVRNLIVRPAKNFREGHNYIVALRYLKDKDGKTIAAGDAFSGYRDGTTSDARSEHMDWIFSRLKKAGIKRTSLFLAWDFTVASERNLSERMLHLRDDAFAKLGDTNLADRSVQGSAPTWQVYPDLPDDQVRSAPDAPVAGNVAEGVDGITSFTPCDPSGCQPGQSDRLLRIVRGGVVVPCYLSSPECAPGGAFVYGANGLPIENPTTRALADFVCIVPRSVL